MPTKLGEITEEELKEKLINHYGGGDRKMCRSLQQDHYGYIGTVFYSLNGSPPKGYAIYRPMSYELFLYDASGKRFKIYKQATIKEIETMLSTPSSW